MARYNKPRSLEWGSAKRPKISSKLGAPNPTEGSDGDIQVRQTNLGAKLFSKLGGRWYDSPLGIDGKVKFGTNLSNYLSIDNDSVDIFTDNVKVASFGATTTVKDINLTGKITITSAGSQNVCIGTGNSDVSGADNNISIGVNAGASLASGDVENIFIGTQAGEDCVSVYNIGIGFGALKELTNTAANLAVGHAAGNTITTGFGNTYIGTSATASANSAQNETTLGGHSSGVGVTGQGNHTVTLGNAAVTKVYMAQDQGATVMCEHIDMLEITGNPTEPTTGHAVIWMSDGNGHGDDGDVMIASNPAGTTYYNTLFDHSDSSTNTW